MTKGRCLCGAVRYEYDGDPVMIAHCHCESCRRATSSPVATFVLVRRDAVRFTGAAPVAFQSSPGVVRSFCGTCGSPISYHTDRRPEILDLYAGTLEQPNGLGVRFHVHTGEQLDWFEVLDDLPRYATIPQDGGPSRVGPRRG